MEGRSAQPLGLPHLATCPVPPTVTWGGGKGGLGIQLFYELLSLRVECSILNMSRTYLRPYVEMRAAFKPCEFYVTGLFELKPLFLHDTYCGNASGFNTIGPILMKQKPIERA